MPRRSLRSPAMAAALALAAPVVEPTTRVPAADPEVRAVFNDPSGDASAQDRIVDALVRLIDRSPAGSEIRGTLYLFTDSTVSEALIAAKRRGVSVRLILDGDARATRDASGKGTGTEYPALASGLGTDLRGRSWVLACPGRRGCVSGRRLDGGAGAVNHNKFFLFSRVGSARDVVFQTSANLTSSQRERLANNAVVIPDQGSGLYADHLSYWDDLRVHGVSTGDGLDDRHAVVISGPFTTYRFPRAETPGLGPKGDPGTDTVISVLKQVSCAGKGARISVAMYAFTRPQVARRLVTMAHDGCTVEVVHNDDPGNLGDEVGRILDGRLSGLKACGGRGRTGIHSKYLLIEGVYQGLPGRRLVFTGSHNYTFPNLRSNDETLIGIESSSLYDSFHRNFVALRTGPQCTAR